MNGVTRAVNAPRRRGARDGAAIGDGADAGQGCGSSCVSFVGRVGRMRSGGHGRAASASRSSTTASNGCRPGSRGSRDEPAGGGERAVGVGGAVARRQAELDRLAGAVEGHEVRPGRRAGADPGDLEDRGRPSRRRRRPRSRPARDRRPTIRRASARAVPDGRSALPRRCHSTIDGSNAPARGVPAGRGLRQPQEQRGAERQVRRDDRGGTVLEEAAADRGRCRRPSRSWRGRTPGCPPRARARRSPRPRADAEASTTTSARGGVGRRPSGSGRPTSTGAGQPAAAAAAAIAPPSRPGP